MRKFNIHGQSWQAHETENGVWVLHKEVEPTLSALLDACKQSRTVFRVGMALDSVFAKNAHKQIEDAIAKAEGREVPNETPV